MDWRDVLNLTGDSITVEDVVACHRRLAKKHHPDIGGSVTVMQEINAAKDAAISELTGSAAPLGEFAGFGPSVRRPRKRKSHRRKYDAW